MAEALFSPNWYRVAKLTPRLRAHAQIHRHVYRGQTWYVLQDLASERFHRFSPSAYYIIGLMDGRSTVEQIWEHALAKLGDDAVTQDEVIQLLGQLHSADVLQSDVSPDAEEMFRRRSTQERKQIQRKVFSIFAWQIPLMIPRTCSIGSGRSFGRYSAGRGCWCGRSSSPARPFSRLRAGRTSRTT